MTKLSELSALRDRISTDAIRLSHQIEAYAAALLELDPDGSEAEAKPQGPAGELRSRVVALQARLAHLEAQAAAFDRAWQKEPKPEPVPEPVGDAAEELKP